MLKTIKVVMLQIINFLHNFSIWIHPEIVFNQTDSFTQIESNYLFTKEGLNIKNYKRHSISNAIISKTLLWKRNKNPALDTMIYTISQKFA